MAGATTLINIVRFTAVAGGGGQAIATHGIVQHGEPQVPDYVARSNGDFEVVATTSTTVTVQNNGDDPADCDVWLELKHSIPRVLPAGEDSLSPRPFVPAGGSSIAAGDPRRFLYTCAFDDGSDFTVDIPGDPMASVNYLVIGQLAGVAELFLFEVTAADRTTTTFRVQTSIAVTAGDQIYFYVDELD